MARPTRSGYDRTRPSRLRRSCTRRSRPCRRSPDSKSSKLYFVGQSTLATMQSRTLGSRWVQARPSCGIRRLLTPRPAAQLLAFNDLRSRLPASDAEIRTALSRLRVVTRASGHLRPLPPSYLLQLVPATLSSLPLPARLAHPDAAAGNKKKKDKGKAKTAGGAGAPAPEPLTVGADEQDVLDALEAVDCSDEDLARQFLGFFGAREMEGRRPRWALDVVALVKELGIVLMAQGGVRSGLH